MKRIITTMTMCFAMFSSQGQQLDPGFQILPQPQKIEVYNNEGIKGSALSYIVAADSIQIPVLGTHLSTLPHLISKGKGIRLILTQANMPKSVEGYVLEITANDIRICARSNAGLFYGCQTLEQLITDSYEHNLSIPQMKITDWPAIAYRSVHFDNKNHLDDTKYYYDLIDKLATYKINGVIWEIEDKLRFIRRPEVGAPNALSKQEIQAICRYAKERYIEISPLIQGLGHATYILKHHWELRENMDNDGDFCPSNPKTYEVLFDLYRDAIEAMPYGKYLHIGGDEVSSIGTDQRCKATGKSPFELQLEWLNKVCDFAVKNGRTPIFWDDMPFKFAKLWYPINFELPEAETRRLMDFSPIDKVINLFPKNCIYMRWNYGDSKVLGNQLVLDWYAKNGLKVMAATAASEATGVHLPYPNGRLDYIKGFSEVAQERKLMGIFATAWDDTSPHLKTVERSYIAQAEFGWNPKGRTVDGYKVAHAQREFGLSKEYVNFITDMEKMEPVSDSLLATKGHRSPGFGVGEFTLLELPNPSKPGAWTVEYNDRIDAAKGCVERYFNASVNITEAINHALRNRYTLQVYEQINHLLYFSPQIVLALYKYDNLQPGKNKDLAFAEIKKVCESFYTMRSNFLEVLSKTRFMDNPDGYIAGNSHHKHLASGTNNSDWQFYFELPMVKKIESWIAEQK